MVPNTGAHIHTSAPTPTPTGGPPQGHAAHIHVAIVCVAHTSAHTYTLTGGPPRGHAAQLPTRCGRPRALARHPGVCAIPELHAQDRAGVAHPRAVHAGQWLALLAVFLRLE